MVNGTAKTVGEAEEVEEEEVINLEPLTVVCVKS
jgi:hypothetical protein